MKKGTVYKITNPKKQTYIGSTTRDINVRFKEYRQSNIKYQIKLFNSFKKYGIDNHKFEIIEECELDIVRERETYYGLLNNVLDREKGLNLKLPKLHDNICLSEETKNKIRISRLNKKHSEKVKNKMSESRKKYIKENGKYIPKYKKILNLNNNIIYESAKEAETYLNITKEYIARIASGKIKSKKFNLTYI
jgi:hypothetical protein